MKYILLIAIFAICNTNKCLSQDFIRIGLAHDFKKNNLLQTFSFDFNRTEKVDEKVGKNILYNKKGFYLTPTSSVNVGDGTTSSENNILFQFFAGKSFFGKLHKSNNNLTTSVWNKAIELNPSFTSDKNFNEKLGYLQIKLLANFFSATDKDATINTFKKNALSFSLGAFSNIGYRHSKNYNLGHQYITTGILSDFKYRILNKKENEIYDDWILGIKGNYYFVASELSQITLDKFAGSVKCSVDKRFYKSLYLGLLYKYNTDNPTYSIVHTLEISLKVKY